MEREFTDENFERFLQQNADGLRMHPSDKVWKGISRNLNKRKIRFDFILGISLLATTSLGYYVTEISADKPTGSQSNDKATALLQSRNQFGQPHSNNSSGSVNLSADRNQYSSFQNQKLAVRSEGQIENNFFSNSLSAINSNIDENPFSGTVVDDYFDRTAGTESQSADHRESLYQDPLTIESVINSYKNRSRKKIGLQFHFTPTVSYRKLGENKSYLRSLPSSNTTANSSQSDINDEVTHRPDFGFEFGMTAKYPIGKNVKLTGGLQLNINRYKIKAFSSTTELATIALNSRNGNPDSLGALSRYSNVSSAGYRTDWLQNFYVQLSAPVGVEFNLSGNRNTRFGIATTIQPTYVVSDRAYLISTNYKNYAEVPSLTRRWNVNTSLETFVSYSTGHLQWQVGPQVRYQLLSSYVSKYPVKENLFDFGLKVGISLNNQ
jgi:hypothetical protein